MNLIIIIKKNKKKTAKADLLASNFRKIASTSGYWRIERWRGFQISPSPFNLDQEPTTQIIIIIIKKKENGKSWWKKKTKKKKYFFFFKTMKKKNESHTHTKRGSVMRYELFFKRVSHCTKFIPPHSLSWMLF